MIRETETRRQWSIIELRVYFQECRGFVVNRSACGCVIFWDGASSSSSEIEAPTKMISVQFHTWTDIWTEVATAPCVHSQIKWLKCSILKLPKVVCSTQLSSTSVFLHFNWEKQKNPTETFFFFFEEGQKVLTPVSHKWWKKRCTGGCPPHPQEESESTVHTSMAKHPPALFVLLKPSNNGAKEYL